MKVAELLELLHIDTSGRCGRGGRHRSLLLSSSDALVVGRLSFRLLLCVLRFVLLLLVVANGTCRACHDCRDCGCSHERATSSAHHHCCYLLLLARRAAQAVARAASSSALTSSTTSGGMTERVTRKPPASSIAFLISTAQRCSKSRISPDVLAGSDAAISATSSGVKRPIVPDTSMWKPAKRGSSLLSSSSTTALPWLSRPTKTTSTSAIVPFSTTFAISRAMLPSKSLPSNPITVYSSGPSVINGPPSALRAL